MKWRRTIIILQTWKENKSHQWMINCNGMLDIFPSITFILFSIWWYFNENINFIIPKFLHIFVLKMIGSFLSYICKAIIESVFVYCYQQRGHIRTPPMNVAKPLPHDLGINIGIPKNFEYLQKHCHSNSSYMPCLAANHATCHMSQKTKQ